MMRDNRYFQGVLTRVNSKALDESIVKKLAIVHSMEGEIQNFLHSFADKCNYPNVRELFNNPVQWKSIALDLKHKFKVNFDKVEFEATLTEIKIRRSYKKGVETYTYTILLDMEPDKDIDPILETFLNQKEIDENGKKKLVMFDIMFEPVEKLMVD